MKIKVKLYELCCANCAAKIEERVGKLAGVESVVVNFITEKMILEADETMLDEIKPQIEKIVQKVESNVKIEYI